MEVNQVPVEGERSAWVMMRTARRRILKYWVCGLIFSLGLVPAPAVLGQTETATVGGLVLDGSGLPVAGGTVVARETMTNVTRETVTNSSGLYAFPFLKPGNYELRVNKADFKQATATLVLQVNQSARMDFELEVGAINEVIAVSATESLMQMENMAVGGQVAAKNIVELPGRNIQTLIGLSAGIVNLSLPGYTDNGLTPLQPGRGALAQNLSIGGHRQTGNSYLLDGISNTDGHINAFVTAPSAESLQELRVQTSTSSAAFGQVAGGTVNLVSRSGTNQIHAEFYDYVRNDALNARPYNFNSELGVLPKPALKENQFGASLGGPLWLPRLYQGRNRTFFFVHFEGLEARSQNQGLATVPTERARIGDLSDYGVTIYDPLTLKDGARTPFPRGIIPAGRIDLIALKMLAFTPPPTLPNQIINNLPTVRPSRRHNNQGNIRIDHQTSSGDAVYGTYHLSDERLNMDGNYGPLTGVTTNVRSQNLAINYTHLFGLNSLNNFKLGYSRLRAVDGIYQEGRRDIIGELGINGIERDPLNWGFPGFRLDFIQLLDDDTNRPTNQRDNHYQLFNTATLIRGRHSLNAGIGFQRFEDNFRASEFSRGNFRYSGAFTRGPDPSQPVAETGLALADFLLGFPQQASRSVGSAQAYLWRILYSAYVEDTLRLNSRFTVTLGLRYDYTTPFREKRNNYFNLDFSRLPAPPRLVRIGVDQSPLPKYGVRANRANFAPRLGLSYRFLPQTVLRAGYGTYFVQEIGALYYNLVRNGVRIETNDSPVTLPLLTTANAFNRPEFGLPSYFYIDPNSSTPYVQQWNLGIQREFPQGILLEAVYAGSKGTHLFRYRNWNNAFHVETGENLDPRAGTLQDLRTFPSLGQIIANETSSSSTYHSLQVRFEKRFSATLSSINSFTWAKSIDDADVPVKDFYQSPGAQDERNLQLERGLSAFDIRKRFTSALVYQLPFGGGKRFLSEGWMSRLVGPWQVSSILTFQDGYPQDLRGFVTQSTIGGVLQRPNVVPGKKLVLSDQERRQIPATSAVPHPEFLYYNSAALAQPGPFELGNAGRNIGPTPGFANLDLAVFRIIPLGEGRQLQLRGDFTNALNLVNLGIPIPSYEFVGFFGQLVTAGQMRSVTLSAKFRF